MNTSNKKSTIDQSKFVQESTNFTYDSLRNMVGILGIALPLIMLIYTYTDFDCQQKLLNSISAYFHTEAGHYFSSISLFIGLILFFSSKHDQDNLLYRIAAIMAIIVGFVPNLQLEAVNDCLIRQNSSKFLSMIHLVSAIIFFVLISYLCYFRFSKSNQKRRNVIYKFCGACMFSSIIAVLIFWKVTEGDVSHSWYRYKIIFWGETVMLVAFSIAWLVKGKADRMVMSWR